MISILKLSLLFDTPISQILALYLYFEGAKNIHVLQVLILVFGGGLRFLTGVQHLDLDLNMVNSVYQLSPESFRALASLDHTFLGGAGRGVGVGLDQILISLSSKL